jgi:hypothetical protein
MKRKHGAALVQGCWRISNYSPFGVRGLQLIFILPPLKFILYLPLNSVLDDLSRLSLPIFKLLEDLVNLVHGLIRLGQTAQQVVHNGSIGFEFAFLDLFEDLQYHLKCAMFLARIHKKLKEFQVQFRVFDGRDAPNHLNELLETEPLLDIILVA